MTSDSETPKSSVEAEEPTLSEIILPTPEPSANSPASAPATPSGSPSASAPTSAPPPSAAAPRAAQSPAPQAQAPRTVRMPQMGPLDTLMKDPSITEIMVNDLRNILIEKEGRVYLTPLNFQTIDELNRITRNILDTTGRILSPDQPYVDVMLPDGSRVNIVGPPLTLNGPCITIRKFPTHQFTMEDLIRSQTLDKKIAFFLNACVLGKLNILVCGGTGSGKTTLLNVLLSFIPKAERLILIEDTPELLVNQVNHVRLQTKPQTPASAPVPARELVANSLRMRPDRIIVGECRKAEAMDMLQAMNTGHSGSMTTLHANTPRDGLSRLETLCMMGGLEIPLTAIRRQIANAIDVIIQVRRFRDGKRKITNVSEVTGMEGEMITLQDIFLHESSLDENHPHHGGVFKPTGFVPTFIDLLQEEGIQFPPQFFS